MSQGDQFHQYGYDHYLKAPKRPKTPQSKQGHGDGRSGLLRNIQSPAFASVILLAAAILFVSVIVMTYPSDESQTQPIPVVKADLRPVKEVPADAGGMEIPNKESTILARAGMPSVKDERQKIENLLARKKHTPTTSKGLAISRAMEGQMSEPTENIPLPRSEEAGAINILSASEGAAENPSETVDDVATADVKPDFEIKEPKADDILQKIGSSQSDETTEQSDEFVMKVASAAVASKPIRKNVSKPAHAAGQSPETIDFVRSVLDGDKKAKPPQNIEPAVGASTNVAITAGSYFVQLASITDPARAPGEWTKMQKKYGVLSSAAFRIQEASLSNGKFYRIQAGPMSRSSANRICDSLKRAKKPGGCIVVK